LTRRAAVPPTARLCNANAAHSQSCQA
jgi:hypothetical protein